MAARQEAVPFGSVRDTYWGSITAHTATLAAGSAIVEEDRAVGSREDLRCFAWLLDQDKDVAFQELFCAVMQVHLLHRARLPENRSSSGLPADQLVGPHVFADFSKFTVLEEVGCTAPRGCSVFRRHRDLVVLSGDGAHAGDGQNLDGLAGPGRAGCRQQVRFARC